MDYCSTCRRHLNGALVCPGCGAYAPDIAPSVIGGPAVRGGVSAAAEPAAAVTPPAPRPRDTASPAPAPSGIGRAARRRQLTRWRKTQRRALVATAVALVGGGLTLASMDRGNGDRAQAATAPDFRGMGSATESADGTTDPGSTATSPDRTPQSPRAGDDERGAPAETAQASPAPSRTESVSERHTEVTPRPRTTAPDSVSRSGARSEANGSVGAEGSVDTGSGSASVSGSGSGSGTATRPTPPPPPPAADDGDAAGGTERGEGSRPAPTTPPAGEQASSQQLCLLVICLG
ncbi:hypothetical protein AB0L56_05655 [Streptomyces sp. NPDC052079]|uniref:SCO2400 family protein n=1 Tax=Streptomyces sp. NPDC052079 TaxID=3155526 RepID=UPI00343E4D8C